MLDFLAGYVMGERSAARAASFARGAAAASASIGVGELHDLETRLERLLLAVDALWSLLKETGFTDEQLIERIRRLDEEDGVLDGRRRTPAVRCTSCNSMVGPGRATCSICGEPLPESAAGPLEAI